MLSKVHAIIFTSHPPSRLALPKLHEIICGKEMIMYPIAAAADCAVPITVWGALDSSLKQRIEQKYSHVQYTDTFTINGDAEYFLIMPAYCPLITPILLQELATLHHNTNAAVSLIAAHTTEVTDAYSYVTKKGTNVSIGTSDHLNTQDVCCINANIYIMSREFLTTYRQHHSIENGNDFIAMINYANNHHGHIAVYSAPFDVVRAAHSYQELWAIEQIQRASLIRSWMERGVRFTAPHNVHLDYDVTIGTDTIIGNGVQLLHGTRIGNHTTVGAFSILEQATLGDHVTVHPHSMITKSTIGDYTEIGPFAHIQTDTTIGTHCSIGNFVETKRSIIGNDSKAKHLTYLGDAHIGTRVNMGAGTITCNYDGKAKHITHIEDNVFIGSNNSLVAPVTIGKDAFTAAGSTITENVPSGALAIGRARQVNKEGYARRNNDPLSHDESNDDAKPSVSFVGATKSTSMDI